ncbi:hypothetical protein EYF80_021228 [Liparis tanakae]|uniref:Uncharacterized protein n=1 Tax=Liparis tanakae TaxID=230148 RepID=A0A4Z2HUJ9_9TELE|nr:hypothetical protein EYF80_021228 [Liparis tanakae]
MEGGREGGREGEKDVEEPSEVPSKCPSGESAFERTSLSWKVFIEGKCQIFTLNKAKDQI